MVNIQSSIRSRIWYATVRLRSSLKNGIFIGPVAAIGKSARLGPANFGFWNADFGHKEREKDGNRHAASAGAAGRAVGKKNAGANPRKPAARCRHTRPGRRTRANDGELRRRAVLSRSRAGVRD